MAKTKKKAVPSFKERMKKRHASISLGFGWDKERKARKAKKVVSDE